MTSFIRESGREKLGRLVFESENYDESVGTDRSMSRWLCGCTFEKDCTCYKCRSGMEEYWNSVNNG